MQGAAQQSALKLLTAEVVRQVARVLETVSIPVMPLKGALWQQTLYEPHEARPLVDVDLLVPPGTFAVARRTLVQAGFEAVPNPQGAHEQEFAHESLPLRVDLHDSLFARFRYRLPSREVFARATSDRLLFGVGVQTPHPLDQLAHLLGHLATDHRPGNATYREDFARLIARADISPTAAAVHLQEHGLSRAARFAIPELGGADSESWCESCLRALGPDPLGTWLAQTARQVVRRNGRYAVASALAGHALNTNPLQIGAAFGWAAYSKLRARLL